VAVSADTGGRELAQVRVSGTTAACRRLLNALDAAADVQDVRGPYLNRTTPGVRFYATVLMHPTLEEPTE